MDNNEIQADIRNKLSPLANLIKIIENTNCIKFTNPEIENIFYQNIEQVKKSITYLSNIYENINNTSN